MFDRKTEQLPHLICLCPHINAIIVNATKSQCYARHIFAEKCESKAIKARVDLLHIVGFMEWYRSLNQVFDRLAAVACSVSSADFFELVGY